MAHYILPIQQRTNELIRQYVLIYRFLQNIVRYQSNFGSFACLLGGCSSHDNSVMFAITPELLTAWNISGEYWTWDFLQKVQQRVVEHFDLTISTYSNCFTKDFLDGTITLYWL